jgi:alkylation response protein AidB-like acyl-CoA dehydrogenase
MPNPENIVKHRFKKGQSGNPKGKVKLPDIREALAKILAEEKDGVTALEATLAALRAKATKGDIRAAEALLDRAFGKPRQSIDHTSDGKPLPSAIRIELVDPTPEP